VSFEEKIQEHFDRIPNKMLPIGKISWLQEWMDTKELVLKWYQEIVVERNKKLQEWWKTDFYDFIVGKINLEQLKKKFEELLKE